MGAPGTATSWRRKPASSHRSWRGCFEPPPFLGILDQPARDRFAATPVAEGLRSGGRGLRELAIALTEPGVWRAWERLPEAIASSRSTAGGRFGATLCVIRPDARPLLCPQFGAFQRKRPR